MSGAGKRRWWHRRKATRQNGTLVYDATVEHRCKPPSAERVFDEWHVKNEARYPEGTVWRCDCGLLWVSTMNNGPWGRRGLWLTWERPFMRDREYVERLGLVDAEPDEDDTLTGVLFRSSNPQPSNAVGPNSIGS